jgi:hypothetical protein
MKIKELFDKWSLTGLKVNLKFLELDWAPSDKDKDAAWEMYVELITRVTTQHLLPDEGDEQTALESIHSLFGITRGVIKQHGRHCEDFSRIAVVILNQRIRPFTAKWHRLSVAGELESPDRKKEFRDDLESLQEVLRGYTGLLATVANVEDMTALTDG